MAKKKTYPIIKTAQCLYIKGNKNNLIKFTGWYMVVTLLHHYNNRNLESKTYVPLEIEN